MPGRLLARSLGDPLRIGPLRLGMSEDEVERALGEPSRRFEPQFDQVTGQHTHVTTYDNGASLVFLDVPTVAQPGTLLATILEAPCDWEGVGRLRIGLEASQARAILADQIEAGWKPLPSGAEDEAALLLPSSSTLFLVRFHDGQVSDIYLGPEI